MLVVLDESLLKIEKHDQSGLSGLESVLTSAYNGDHFFTSSFSTVRELLKLPLGFKSKAALHRLRANISNHGNLPYPESFVLTITHNSEAKRAGARQWELPASMFKNAAFPSSIVLGENMLDAEAYIFGSKQARTKHRHKEQCKALPDAGGGSETPVKLQGYINNENGFCFCITDGDYKDPQGTRSSVTNDCVNIADSSAWPSYATDFQGRSIENIIPIELIEDSFEKDPVPSEVSEFRKIKNKDPDTSLYIDAKIGLRYCHLKKMNIRSPKYAFWTTKVKEHGLNDKIKILESTPMECGGENCIQCTLIKGIGSGTLKRTVGYFRKNTAQKLAQQVPIDSIWCNLGLNIYHWTIADKPHLI